MASIPVSPAKGSAISSVSGAAADTLILAANDNRNGAIFYNDSSAILYLAFGDVTASTSNYSVQIPSYGTFLLEPWNYAGMVRGIWASATGAVKVTEFY